RRYFGSAIWNERCGTTLEAWSGDAATVSPASPPAPMYFLVVAARSAAQPVAAGSAVSFYADQGESELMRLDAQAGELMRLDGLLGQRDAALDRQTAEGHHLAEPAPYLENL